MNFTSSWWILLLCTIDPCRRFVSSNNYHTPQVQHFSIFRVRSSRSLPSSKWQLIISFLTDCFLHQRRERERDGKERRGRKENIQNAWIGFDRFAPCLRSAPGDPLESSLCSMQHVRNTHTHTCTHTNTGSEAGTHNLSVECVILYFRRSKFSYDNVGSTRRQGRIFFSSALPDCPQSSFSPSFCSSVRCCFSCKSAATTTSLPLTSTSTHTIPAIIFISKKIKHKTETAHFTISSSLTATNTSLSLSVCVFVCVFIALCILS